MFWSYFNFVQCIVVLYIFTLIWSHRATCGSVRSYQEHISLKSRKQVKAWKWQHKFNEKSPFRTEHWIKLYGLSLLPSVIEVCNDKDFSIQSYSLHPQIHSPYHNSSLSWILPVMSVMAVRTRASALKSKIQQVLCPPEWQPAALLEQHSLFILEPQKEFCFYQNQLNLLLLRYTCSAVTGFCTAKISVLSSNLV